MAKDPATLWYWADWHGGTYTFTRHLKGCYMDLLYAQFNSGRLSLAQIKTVLGQDYGTSWPLLQEKFKRDENDNYYNEKAEAEKEKRRKFSESRRKNLNSSHMKPHMESHMVNANIIESSIMVYDAEKLILSNQIEFERICMAAKKRAENAKQSLHKYHLYLEEKEQYPKGKKALFAGFEKWLLNENGFKKFNDSDTDGPVKNENNYQVKL